MNLLKAYLQKPSTQRVLSRKPSDKGFSLIELVVVIVVLAVLTAIALPNFLGVSNDATARSAQQAAITAFKECNVAKARGTLTANAKFANPTINGYVIYAMDRFDDDKASLITAIAAKPNDQATVDANATSNATASTSCFTGDGNADGTLREIVAAPATANEYPAFKVSKSGNKFCMTGLSSVGDTTYNIGCGSTADNDFQPNWK